MARPEQGTPEWDLWITAIECAAAVPYKQGKYSQTAGVPWGLMHELRAALEALGIDWRTVKAKNEAAQKRAAAAKGR